MLGYIMANLWDGFMTNAVLSKLDLNSTENNHHGQFDISSACDSWAALRSLFGLQTEHRDQRQRFGAVYSLRLFFKSQVTAKNLEMPGREMARARIIQVRFGDWQHPANNISPKRSFAHVPWQPFWLVWCCEVAGYLTIFGWFDSGQRNLNSNEYRSNLIGIKSPRSCHS